MKSFKKLFAVLAATAILASTTPTQIFAAGFSDELEGAYEYAYGMGITTQSSIDSANMYGTLIRSHMAKMMVEYAKEMGKTADTSVEVNFTDIADQSTELQGYIEEAAQMGLMGLNADGSVATKFNPYGVVTRAQFGTVLSRVLYGDANNGSEPYYADHLKALKDAGIMNNISNPNADEVRGYVMLMMQRADEDVTPATCSTAENILACTLGTSTCPAECKETPVEINKSGSVKVSLSSDTLSSQKISKGAQGVPAATFVVKAGEEDVTLRAVTLKREGMDAANAVSEVAIFVDGQRVSTSKSFNSTTDEVAVNLNPYFVVKAGQKVELVAKVTTLTTAGADFAISLKDMETSAKDVDADYPIVGNNLEVGTANATELTLNTDGSVSSVKVGNEKVDVLKFKLENNSSSETVDFSSITLKEEGTVDEGTDLANFRLYYDGSEVAKATKTSGKYVTFNLSSPLTIKESKTAKFVVKADILGGASKKINLSLDKTLDLTAQSSKYGYVKVVDSLAGADVSIDAGALTVTAVEPAQTEITKDKDNVVLGGLKVTVGAGKDLELQKFTVKFDNVAGMAGAKTLADYLENVELYDASKGTVYDLTLDADNKWASDTDLTIPLKDASTTNFQIRADIKDISVAGFSFNIKIDSMGSANNTNFFVSELVEDTQITDIVPNSVSYKKIEGTTSAATVNGLPLTTAKTAVIGSKDVEITKFEVEAGNSSKLLIKEIKAGATYDTVAANFNKNVVSQVKLYKGSISEANLLKTKSSSDIAAGDVTFNNLAVEVAKNTKVTFYVTADLVNDATLATHKVKARNLVAADFTLEDSESDDVIPTVNDAITHSEVTIANVGTLAIANNTSDSDLNTAKTVVAGNSDFVASFETTSTDESILLKDITIASTKANFANAVSEIALYKADKTTEIARKSVSSQTTTFTNLDYAVAQGSEKLYVKVISNNIGKDKVGAAIAGDQLTVTVTKAEGKSSNKTLTLGGARHTSQFVKTFSVVPVAAVASREAVAPSSLTVGSVLAKVKLTPVANTNTDANGVALKTYGKTVTVKATTLSNLTNVTLSLRKAGESTELVAGDAEIDVLNGTVTFDLSNVSAADKELLSNGTVFDIVVTGYTIAAGTNGSIELSLDKGLTSVAVTADSAVAGAAVQMNLKDSIGFGISTELK